MLFQIEILIFFSSFLYILYFLGDRSFVYYKKQLEKKQEKKQRQELRQEKRKTREKMSTNEEKQEEKKHYISPEESEKIREISKRAQINISR